MLPRELLQAVENDHLALTAFAKGDPEPKKLLYSRKDDATLANPLGPPARGWSQICAVLEAAASTLRDGDVTFERISEYAREDLGYTLDMERYSVKVGGADALSDVSLRVTTIFRLEPDGWKIVHRHADPITTPRPAESMLEQ